MSSIDDRFHAQAVPISPIPDAEIEPQTRVAVASKVDMAISRTQASTARMAPRARNNNVNSKSSANANVRKRSASANNRASKAIASPGRTSAVRVPLVGVDYESPGASPGFPFMLGGAGCRP